FGYFGQKADGKKIIDHTEKPIHAGPAWADNGSFLVIRRLRQDVNAFHSFLRDTAKQLNVRDPLGSSAARLVGSKLVGRWPSGALVVRTPGVDNPELAIANCANNNFEYQKLKESIPPRQDGHEYRFDCSDGFPTAKTDDNKGDKCPFSGHIRKVYPRDDV